MLRKLLPATLLSLSFLAPTPVRAQDDTDAPVRKTRKKRTSPSGSSSGSTASSSEPGSSSKGKTRPRRRRGGSGASSSEAGSSSQTGGRQRSDAVAGPLIQRKLKRGITQTMPRGRKLARLMANLKTIGFRYTGAATGPATVRQIFAGTQRPAGDCETLRELFILAARQLLNITLGRDGKTNAMEPIFVWGGGPVTGRRARGNVDNGKHWFFDSHYWAVDPQSNRVYDVLFNRAHRSRAAMERGWTPVTMNYRQRNFSVKRTNPDRTVIFVQTPEGPYIQHRASPEAPSTSADAPPRKTRPARRRKPAPPAE